jgi:hypothetical protein
MPDAAQAITSVIALVAIVMGLFFRRYGRAAIAGVILGAVIVAVLAWGLVNAATPPNDLAGSIGYIAGRVIATSVLAALLGCLIHRGIARLFRRKDVSTS